MYPVTKFHPPTVGPRSLRRDDVLGVLRGKPYAAVLVRAPAGYGKTTTVVQWLRGLAARHVWVTLDDDDNDPAGLWAAIAAAARASGLIGRAEIDPIGTGSLRTTTIVPLIDAVAGSGDDWVLVLDDAHLVTQEDAVASLDWFLGRMPENLTAIVITRSSLELPAAERLRARGHALELTASTLSLDRAAIDDLLSTCYGLSPRADEMERIAEATGGWPAAVALVGSALSHGQTLARVLSQRPDDDAGLGPLVREGLAGSGPEDYALLRETSVLERFDADVLAAVLQRERAWDVAMDVARTTGLIVALDDDGRWWRLHHLVRERLHSELGQVDPVRRRLLHQRASVRFEQQNDIAATVHHLLGAGDYDAIADILSDVRANSVVPRQSLGLSWLERIPQAALDRDPRLAFWEAWASATGGDPARRDRALARGRLAAGAGSIAAFDTWDDVEDFVNASACYDDVGAARRAGERFLTRYASTSPLAPLVELRLATMLYLHGDCDDALRALRNLDEGPPLARPLRLLVPAYGALCAFELGDLSGARAKVARCVDARVTYRLGADPVYLPAEQALARLHTEQGEPDRGLATALNALDCASQSGDTVLVVPHLLLEVARAHLALARPEEAAVALNQAEELCVGRSDVGALPARIDAIRDQARLTRPTQLAREALSRRELEVLALLPTSLSASEIATELFVSVNTARSHIKAIHRKLGVTTRADAVVAARRAGLVGVPESPTAPFKQSPSC